MTHPLRVLFLCTGNSARSQMAEGFLRALGGSDFEAFSAGTDPKGVNPWTIRTMQDADIDISDQTSKHLRQYLDDQFDFIITVCDRANESCPVFPGDAERIHWSFDDPADPNVPEDKRAKLFQRVRDEIRTRIRLFISAQRKVTAPLT